MNKGWEGITLLYYWKKTTSLLELTECAPFIFPSHSKNPPTIIPFNRTNYSKVGTWNWQVFPSKIKKIAC